MSLTTNSKQSRQRPVFYKDEFDKNDLKVQLGGKIKLSEYTLADMLISGFIRDMLHIRFVPLLIVERITNSLNESAHLPNTMALLIPFERIFNGTVLNLKTPIFSDMSISARTVLRIFLQWRLNCKSEICGSPKANLSSIILNGNVEHFSSNEGSWWLKQILPYHPEIINLELENNNINDQDILLIIQAMQLRHDNQLTTKSIFPIKLLETLNLSNNNITDKNMAMLLYTLSIYTPKLKNLDLSNNKLTDGAVEAICAYLEGIDDKPKKERFFSMINLRHNEITIDGVKLFNESLGLCHESWKVKIELGSNPTKQLYSFDANQKIEIDPRINLHGT